MASDGSSYVRVVLGGKSVLIIIKLKMVVATELQNVPMKDMIELLIYLLYVMEDNSLLKICGVLSGSKAWHCLNVKMNDENKLEIVDYVHYCTSEEITLLGFLPSLVETLQLTE